MKILHVLDVSIPRLKGYAIRSQGIVEAQAKIGLCPIVISSPRHGNVSSSKEVFNGITYYRTNRSWLNMRLPFLSELLEITLFSRRIEEIIKEEKIDLVHAHSPVLCGTAAYIAAKKYSLPIIYEIRAFWEDAAVSSGKCKYNNLRYKITRAVETRLCKKVNRVVTICKGLMNDILKRGIEKDKVDIVSNGVFMDWFRTETESQELKNRYQLTNSIVLGFVGSFFKFEGVSLLVELMAEIEDHTIRMVLVGEGEEYQKIKQRVKELGLGERVILCGTVPHDEIMKYYSIIDIFIYPRLRERITELTTPLKPLEAMAMKKNIVISDVGGLLEIVPPGCGERFAAGNVKDLKMKVERLLHDKDLKEKQKLNAVNFAKRRNWLNMVEKYQNIYKEVV